MFIYYILQAEISATKPCPSRNPIECQDTPSSFSVLELPFQEDDRRDSEFSDNFSLLRNGNNPTEAPLVSRCIEHLLMFLSVKQGLIHPCILVNPI